MTRGLFVTGTDTGVGKTVVACALIRGLVAQGLRVAGMKPVAAGGIVDTPDGPMNEDVARLREAANVVAPLDEINPYCFDPPIAPHIAADRRGVRIDLEVLAARYAALAARADVVVVEGAGGFLVPLNETEDFGDLARRLSLPVVLVVGMRLGCLNHARLTAEAIRARGLEFAGWVANGIDPVMPASEANAATLESRLGAPLLCHLAHGADRRRPVIDAPVRFQRATAAAR